MKAELFLCPSVKPADAFVAVPVYAPVAEQLALHVRFVPRPPENHDRLLALVASALDRALTAGVDLSLHQSVDVSVGTAR